MGLWCNKVGSHDTSCARSVSSTTAFDHLHVRHVLFDIGAVVVVDIEQRDGFGRCRWTTRQRSSQSALASQVQQHTQVTSRRVVLPRTNCSIHTSQSHHRSSSAQSYRLKIDRLCITMSCIQMQHSNTCQLPSDILVFYCTMLCIARTMPSRDVCLSVCHTPVICRNGKTYPQTFHSATHSSFSTPNGMAIFQRGLPPNGGVQCKGVWKKSWFWTDISLYLRNNEEPYLLWKANSKPYPSFQMIPVSMTLSDL